jgi:hypothetical protein
MNPVALLIVIRGELCPVQDRDIDNGDGSLMMLQKYVNGEVLELDVVAYNEKDESQELMLVGPVITTKAAKV